MGNDFATGYAIGQNDSKNCCSDGGMGMGAWGAWLIPLLLIGLLFGLLPAIKASKLNPIEALRRD